MRADFDLFLVYRWLLATVCTVYAVIITWRSLMGWLIYFAGSRQTAVLGRYTLVLLLRTQLRRFAGELLQIALLIVAFAGLVYLHAWVEG